jgi:hypothetical protein
MLASFQSGQLCPQGGHYGQYLSLDGRYAGASFDRVLLAGAPFPQGLPGHHYCLLNAELAPQEEPLQAFPRAMHQTAWDPNNPVTAG